MAGGASQDVAPVEATWTLTHNGSRPDRVNDLAATDDGFYLLGNVGSGDRMYARVLKTTRPSSGRPEVDADHDFTGAIPVHLEAEAIAPRPDGRLDFAVRQDDDLGTLARMTPDGKIDNATKFDDNRLRPGTLVPRDDGSTLVVGTRYGKTAAAIVADDATVETYETHDDTGTCRAGVPTTDGGCLAAGTITSSATVVEVGPDGTAGDPLDVGVEGDVRDAVGLHGDVVLGGRTTGDFKRGHVSAMARDGSLRWSTELELDTAVEAVTPFRDGILAVGRHVPGNEPWVARVTAEGEVAWEGSLPGGYEGQLTGVHVDGDTAVVAGTVLDVDGDGPGMLLAGLRETDAATTPTASPSPSPDPTDTATPTATPTGTAMEADDGDEDAAGGTATETSAPGFGPLAGLAGLVGGVLTWRRREQAGSETRRRQG